MEMWLAMQKNNRFQIHRIINNNVITSMDKADKEIVLMGKGIAYLKKVGDMITTDHIEKVFVLKESETNRYLDIIENMPAQYFDLSLEILTYAEHVLHVKTSSIAYIMLADHICSAIERCQQGIVMKNEMLEEIKNFYPKEFEVGKAAVLLISDELSVTLPIDEAGFIAFHIINLSSGKTNKPSSDLIQKIVSVIESYFNIKIDKESVYFERFLTHLKYFSNRLFSDKKTSKEPEEDDFLYRMLKIQYAEAAKCVDLIQEYVRYNYKILIKDEEKGYLIIHINNLLMKSKLVTK